MLAKQISVSFTCVEPQVGLDPVLIEYNSVENVFPQPKLRYTGDSAGTYSVSIATLQSYKLCYHFCQPDRLEVYMSICLYSTRLSF